MLFLLVNAVLFIRPAEILPALGALPIYNVLILASLATSLPVLLEQLSPATLARFPSSLCVVLMLPAIVLSHLSDGNLYGARIGGIDFIKVVFYFILLVGLVDTPARLRTFMIVVLVLIVTVGVLALLRFHGVVNVLQITALADNRGGFDETTGERISFMRLQASGIFNDPNDFSCVLAAGALIGAQFMLEQKGVFRRVLFCAPVLLCAYGLAMTHSRGGFLALLAGTATYLVARIGVRRAVPLGVVVLPVLLVAFGGRMTNIDFSSQDDTAAGRVEIWGEGFELFRGAPLLGIGYGEYLEEVGIVAHNSFVHSYVETGLFGGSLFLAAFFIPIWALAWAGPPLGTPADQPADGALRRWRPCVLAVMVAYAVGLCSLSRSYTVSTYLILGLGTVFLRLLARERPQAVPALSGRLFGQLLAVSVGFVILIKLFIRVVT